MRIMGLPEQFDLTMKCMMQNATQPLPDATGASLNHLGSDGSKTMSGLARKISCVQK